MSQRERLKTYVEGFDRALEGGIPTGHIVLLAGTPGTMKSSFTYYMMYHQALENGNVGVYVTLEQSRESLLKQMEKMGMKTQDVRQNLHVLDLGLIRKSLKNIDSSEPWMQVFKGYLAQVKKDLKYNILAIDSLDVLETVANISSRRTDLFYLFEWLRDLETTAYLISEASPERLFEGSYDEGYLADGIIALKMQVVREVETQRRIRCIKMRETNQDPSYYSMIYRGGKFQVTKAISE